MLSVWMSDGYIVATDSGCRVMLVAFKFDCIST